MFKPAALKFSFRPLEWIKYLILLGLLGWVYFPTFIWMADRWFARDSYYGHGFLIPLVTLYWIYKKLPELQKTRKESWPAGFFILLIGGGLHIFSSMMRVYFLSAFSFVFILMGGVASLGGKQFFKKIWFPLFFLILAIPLPLLVISQTTLKMKFFVSDIAAKLLTLTGLPAHREGSYIYTKNSFIIVGDPCSGLRSFLAFICLGFVFAYETRISFWKRSILIAAGLPLAVLSNVIRVYMMGLLAEIYGMHFIEGFIHDASGFVVFIFAFWALMSIRQQLEKS